MGRKILFINNSIASQVIPGILTRFGYHVDTVTDTEAGLKQLEVNPFDVVIVKEIPGAESTDLCRKIRHVSSVPLIIINSNASAESCVRAINAGADYFMRKPFGPLELLARVRCLLQRAPFREPLSIGQPPK
jgi:DNA-binding response OmpR family regulator